MKVYFTQGIYCLRQVLLFIITPILALLTLNSVPSSSFVLPSAIAEELHGTIHDDKTSVLIISIDGFRPEFYLSDEFEAPMIKSLTHRGYYARAMVPVFPSLTYPAHASFATGVRPAKHGVISNTVFDFTTGTAPGWYWLASQLKAPALWDLAHKAGLTTAIIRWPASVGAGVDWFVPEIFQSPGFDFAADWKLIKNNTKPELMSSVLKDFDFNGHHSLEELDIFTTHATIKIMADHHPQLTFVHLINLDFVQHLTGRSSPQTKKALLAMDRNIKQIIDSLDLKNLTVLMVGDHGMIDYYKTIQPNILFKNLGWLKTEGKKLLSWDVIIHAEGGIGIVYLRDRANSNHLEEKVLTEMKRISEAEGKFKVITKAELKKLGAYPEAAMVLEAIPGYTIGGGLDGEFVIDNHATKASHGQLPGSVEIQAGFIAIVPSQLEEHLGVPLGTVESIDVAPTIAKILNFNLPGADGKPLPIFKAASFTSLNPSRRP